MKCFKILNEEFYWKENPFLSGAGIVNFGKLICLGFWALGFLSQLQISSSCDQNEWNWNLSSKSRKTPQASVKLDQIATIFHLKIESKALKCSLWCGHMSKKQGAASIKNTGSRSVPFEPPVCKAVPVGHLDTMTAQGNLLSFVLRPHQHLSIIEWDGGWVYWWPCSPNIFSRMTMSSKLLSPCRRDFRVRPSVKNGEADR